WAALRSSQGRFHTRTAWAAQGKGIDQKASQQQQGWPQPEQCSGGLEGRAIQDEVAVAVHHIRADLIRATALPQLFHDLMAQVHSQLGTRSRNRLVLAHQTTQLSSNFQHYRLLLPLRPRLGLGRGYEKPHAGSQCRHPLTHHHGCCSKRRIKGNKVSSMDSRDTGPICLKRTMPCLSITKVSGTPYTPKSMPTRPSRSMTETS